MPRFARIFFILLASAAGSCSSEQFAQKQVEKKDIRQQLATAYESCVRTSFASQLPTMVDRNMAISGFYGLPNRGKETSRCQRCGHLVLPQHAERRTFETIVLGQRVEPVARGILMQNDRSKQKVALGNHQVAIGELFSQS